MRSRRGTFALLSTVLIWGSTFVVTKSALRDIGPFALCVARFLIAMLILTPLAYRQGYRLRLSLQPTFLRFGLTGIALYYGLQNLALLFTSAVNSVLVVSIVHVVTAILAVWWLKERLSAAQLAGIAVALVGTAILSQSAQGGRDAPRPLLGSLIVLGSVIAWAIYTIQGKQLSTRYSALVSTTASIGAGLLMLLPLAAGEVWLTGWPRLSQGSALAILYLGVVASALPMFLWNYALNHVPATIAALYLNLVPVVGVLIGLLAGERLGRWQIVGGLLTLGGVWVNSRAAPREDASSAGGLATVSGAPAPPTGPDSA